MKFDKIIRTKESPKVSHFLTSWHECFIFLFILFYSSSRYQDSVVKCAGVGNYCPVSSMPPINCPAGNEGSKHE